MRSNLCFIYFVDTFGLWTHHHWQVCGVLDRRINMNGFWWLIRWAHLGGKQVDTFTNKLFSMNTFWIKELKEDLEGYINQEFCFFLSVTSNLPLRPWTSHMYIWQTAFDGWKIEYQQEKHFHQLHFPACAAFTSPATVYTDLVEH